MLQVIKGLEVNFEVEEVEVSEVAENQFVVEFNYEHDMLEACFSLETFTKAGFVQTDVSPQRGRFFRFEKDGVIVDLRYHRMGGFMSGGIYEPYPVRGLGNLPKLEKAVKAVEQAKKVTQVVDVFEEGGSVSVIAKDEDDKYFHKYYVGIATEKDLVVVNWSTIMQTQEEVEQAKQQRQIEIEKKAEYERQIREQEEAEKQAQIRKAELKAPKKGLLARIFS